MCSRNIHTYIFLRFIIFTHFTKLRRYKYHKIEQKFHLRNGFFPFASISFVRFLLFRAKSENVISALIENLRNT